jgi:carbonic anhydrase/acetyltransferase-like protein (isoleucine patch superfamily)
MSGGPSKGFSMSEKITDEVRKLIQTKPKIAADVFVARGVQLCGDITIGAGSSLWFNTVLRVHVDWQQPLAIGNDVTVGHLVQLHGCLIEDQCLIGIGAIILSGAVIKTGSIIGAGAVVTEGAVIPERSLVLGMPGKPVRPLGPEVMADHLRRAAEYVELARAHRQAGGK